MKTISELSLDTRILVERLKALRHDEEVTYQELSELIGRSVQGEARHTLQSARRIVEREERIVTACVRNQSVKRLADAVVVTTVGVNARQGMRRKAARAIRKLVAVDFPNLPNELKVKQNAEVSQLGALRVFAKDTAQRKIAAHVQQDGTHGALAVSKTLAMFVPKK
jgi:hypothetical protein